MDVSKYFIVEDTRYLCKYPMTVVRIKKTFFEKGLAEFVLNEIESLGIFYIYFYKDLDMTKEPERLLLKLPMSFRMIPSDIVEVSEGGEPSYELRFLERDVFMKSRSLIQHVRNVERGFDLLFNNFMPDSISYSEEFQLLKNCKNLNKIGLGVSDQLLALIVAEANRDPKDITQPFRMAIKKDPKISEYERHVVRLVDIARLNDAFMGLASAHASRSLTVGITQHRKKLNDQKAGKKVKDDAPLVVDIIK